MNNVRFDNKQLLLSMDHELEMLDIESIYTRPGSINQIVLEINGFIKNTLFPIRMIATRTTNEEDDLFEWILWSKHFPSETFTPRTISTNFKNFLEEVISIGGTR